MAGKQKPGKRPQSPVLEVKGLRIVRGGQALVDGVDWKVVPGEHWVILGANGSGKTSLLSSLTGYLPPTWGDIAVLGKSFGQADWRELRRRVGLVSSSLRELMSPSEPALLTVISGKEAIIDFWGKPTEADRRKARRILRDIECESLADRPWLFLSQGERQRVLIGRALMANPRLLILDEPCAGLDPAAREHFLQFLQRLSGQSKAPTLVLVTHHVEEIMPGFTHVLVLKSGRVLAAGTKTATLNAKNLSAAFGVPTRLGRKAGRYHLAVAARRGKVV